MQIVLDQKGFYEAALLGLEAQKTRIEKMITGIKQLAGKKPVTTNIAEAAKVAIGARKKHANGAGAKRKKRNLSPEARQRIADAQKKRWAAFRKDGAAA